MKKIRGYSAAAFAACLMLFLISIPPAGAFVVPDTGITQCYDADGNQIPCPSPGQAYYGQDGNAVYNGMSFTDNINGTVTDNVTHLVWQKVADATATWADAVSNCTSLDSANFGGHNSGWRLPALVELNTLLDLAVDTSTGTAAILPIFTGTAPAAYWTSTEDPDNSANAWFLNFGTTEDNVDAKTTAHYVRCVWEEVAP